MIRYPMGMDRGKDERSSNHIAEISELEGEQGWRKLKVLILVIMVLLLGSMSYFMMHLITADEPIVEPVFVLEAGSARTPIQPCITMIHEDQGFPIERSWYHIPNKDYLHQHLWEGRIADILDMNISHPGVHIAFHDRDGDGNLSIHDCFIIKRSRDGGIFNGTDRLHILVEVSGKKVGRTSFLWTFSPEVYFHVDVPVTTDVRVEIPEGRITTSLPAVSMGASAEWRGVRIETNGTVVYEGVHHPFLYYEGTFGYERSNFGWLIEERDGELYLEGGPVTKDEIIGFMREEMMESGLSGNEIDFLIQRIIDLNMLNMEKPFMTIHYIPMEDVEDVIRLTTSHEFTLMRRHFAFYEHDGPVEMEEPEYEGIEDSPSMIHETAVNKF